MSYCPKCGNKVDDTMVFCPRCGASLKGTQSTASTVPTQPYSRNEKAEKNEKNEKNEKQEKGEDREKQEKGERGFIGYLIGGLILITLGVFSIIQLSNPNATGQNWAVMLLVIGIIIIIGAIYVAFMARKRSPIPH